MKTFKSFIILGIVFLASQSHAQIFIQKLNLNEKDGVTFTKVRLKGKFTAIYGARIYVDHGQKPPESSYANRQIPVTILDEPSGNIIEFNSIIGLIN